jgi:hypothetical protein
MSIFSRIREVCGPPDGSHSPPSVAMTTQRQRGQRSQRRQHGLPRATTLRLSSLLEIVPGLLVLPFLALFLRVRRLFREDSFEDIYAPIRWDLGEVFRLSPSPLSHSYSSYRRREIPYVRGVGWVIGDPSCRYNARSGELRCAVNPIGPCVDCSSYERDSTYRMPRNWTIRWFARH